MFEIKKAKVGMPIHSTREYADIETGLGQFVHEIKQATKDRESLYIVLSRPNGTSIATCSIYMGDPPS